MSLWKLMSLRIKAEREAKGERNMVNNPFGNSPEISAKEDLKRKTSEISEEASQAHEELLDKVRKIDKRDCAIIYDTALVNLQKEIDGSEQDIKSKGKKDQKKQ